MPGRRSHRDDDEDDRDDYRDRDEPRRRPSDSSGGMTMWLILGGVGLLVVGGVITLVVVLLLPKASPRQITDREEMKKALIGKTKDEVTKIIGKPDRTFDGDLWQSWYYTPATRNPRSGETDKKMTVRFDSGKVGDVFFE